MEASGGKKVAMVAIDSSECSHYALEWALKNLQESIINSEMVILTVQPISDYSYVVASSLGAARDDEIDATKNQYFMFCSFGLPAPELIRNFQQQQQKTAIDLLEKAKEICENHGITARTVTEVGDPKEKICEAVEKFKATLLVVGSHSRGAIKRAFLGSVSNYCIHNAKCPVLVVKKV